MFGLLRYRFHSLPPCILTRCFTPQLLWILNVCFRFSISLLLLPSFLPFEIVGGLGGEGGLLVARVSQYYYVSYKK